MSPEELAKTKDLLISAFAREIRAAQNSIDLAKIVGFPKFRAFVKRARYDLELEATLRAEREEQEPSFKLKPTAKA